MSNAEPIKVSLFAENLTKFYQKDQGNVIENLSLKIETGQIVAVIGPNGSGKSTLLSLLAGLLSPDAGRITLDGTKVEGPEKNLVPGHEDIKLVFQDYGLKPAMTVKENIRYQLLAFKETYQKTRIDEVIDICHLRELKDRKPRELSGGQQQRVALANAIATDPAVLLMDEPFSNLDPFTKEEIIREIKRISKETETTVVIVTHDALDALSLADKVAFLDQGRILQYDTPEQIYHHPGSLKIGQFLGHLSILSEYTKNKFDLDLKMKYAIRAEHLHFHSTGIEFKILDSHWKGFYTVTFLDQKDDVPLVMLTSKFIESSLKTIRISPEFDKLIQL